MQRNKFSDTVWNEIWQRLGGRDYLVLDTETTGLVAPELVSVAVVDNHGVTLLHELVRPGKAIEPTASAITGITNAMVQGRPEFPAIYPRLSELLTGKLVVIYNAHYDLKVLRNTCQRYGLQMPHFDHWCAMEWFARLYGRWDAVKQNYTWQKLSTAARHFGVKVDTAHDARGDAVTTWRIIEAALAVARAKRPPMRPLL